jgi:hypothetical protein
MTVLLIWKVSTDDIAPMGFPQAIIGSTGLWWNFILTNAAYFVAIMFD